MPKSLIRKNQLSPDIADLVGQYGSGFFVPYAAANQFTASLTGQNVVYTTGNQTISGTKAFATRPTVNGTGVLLSGEATAGATVTNVVYTTGSQSIDGVKNFTGTLQYGGNTVATATNLASTGSTLSSRITALSGSSILTYGDQSASGNKTFFTNSVIYSGVNVNYNKDTSVKFSGTTDFTNTINSSGGMNFTSTPNLSTSPNILDIYQEGTWSPRFSGATSSGTYVYSIQSGTYTRIGNIVNIYGLVRLSSITTNGVGILCVNLPFSTNNNDNTQNLISSRWSLATSVIDLKPVTTGDRVSFYKITGVSTGILYNTTGTLLVASDLNASSYINFGGTYQIY